LGYLRTRISRSAVAKSAKPLASHSLASGLIENFTAAENFAQETVAQLEALLDCSR
jgi:hypothetical protein